MHLASRIFLNTISCPYSTTNFDELLQFFASKVSLSYTSACPIPLKSVIYLFPFNEHAIPEEIVGEKVAFNCSVAVSTMLLV